MSHTRLETIEGHTLLAAMHEARRRFGSDVLVQHSEQTASGYAITVELPAPAPTSQTVRASRSGPTQHEPSQPRRQSRPESSPKPPVANPEPAPPDPLLDRSHEPVVEIPRQESDKVRWSRGFEPLARCALAQGYPSPVLEAVQYALRNTRIRLDREGDPTLPRASAQVLASLIPTTSIDDARALAVVGPTGVGKTTTIAKLASLADRRGESVAVLTLDTYRVGAVEQLRAYADLLDVPCEVAFTPADLLRLIERHGDRDRIFIDTTGRSPFDRKALDHLSGHLDRGPIRTALCLPANLRRADATRTIDAFHSPAPSSMLLTKWDETDSPGEVLGLAIERKLPVSHITIGQDVPDDIVEADRLSLAMRAFQLDPVRTTAEVTR